MFCLYGTSTRREKKRGGEASLILKTHEGGVGAQFYPLSISIKEKKREKGPTLVPSFSIGGEEGKWYWEKKKPSGYSVQKNHNRKKYWSPGLGKKGGRCHPF